MVHTRRHGTHVRHPTFTLVSLISNNLRIIMSTPTQRTTRKTRQTYVNIGWRLVTLTQVHRGPRHATNARLRVYRLRAPMGTTSRRTFLTPIGLGHLTGDGNRQRGNLQHLTLSPSPNASGHNRLTMTAIVAFNFSLHRRHLNATPLLLKPRQVNF